MLVTLMEEMFRSADDPAAKADEWLRLFETTAGLMTFPEASPEWSDVAVQEFRDVLMQTIHHARVLAVRQPFDPEADLRRAA